MEQKFKIGFIGNYQNNYIGEVSDESHLARELENLGHIVYKIPRDEWREYVLEGFPKGKYPNIPEDVTFDICIFAKWHHFFDGRFIKKAREKYKCPVFLWVWDYMRGEDWHLKMIEAADLYLSNDVWGRYKDYNNTYYFPFDVADGEIELRSELKKYDVVFFGSCIPQGDRKEWLLKIAEKCNLTIFSWNYEDWQKMGFTANPAVYEDDFAKVVAQSKICLQFSVEDHCWGYWSNRVGKVLTQGGFLLARYAPGMELFLRDGAEYFSSPEEAIEKIDFYLKDDFERERIANRGYEIGKDRFTSKARIKELEILIDRFLKK